MIIIKMPVSFNFSVFIWFFFLVSYKGHVVGNALTRAYTHIISIFLGIRPFNNLIRHKSRNPIICVVDSYLCLDRYWPLNAITQLLVKNALNQPWTWEKCLELVLNVGMSLYASPNYEIMYVCSIYFLPYGWLQASSLLCLTFKLLDLMHFFFNHPFFHSL